MQDFRAITLFLGVHKNSTAIGKIFKNSKNNNSFHHPAPFAI